MSSSIKQKVRSLQRTSSIRKGSRRRPNRRKVQKHFKGQGKGSYAIGGSADDNDTDNIFNNDQELGTENRFLNYCFTQLLSHGVAADGLISQNDAAEFIWDICDNMDHEDIPAFHCPTPTFYNLEPEVQLSFVWFICPHDEQVGLLECLTDLGMQGTDFGYSITSDTMQEAENDVLGFCCSLLPFLEKTNIASLVDPTICPYNLPDNLLGTPAPINQPTPKPTPRPTPSPTSPEVDRSDGTTSSPTRVPTPSVVIVDPPTPSSTDAVPIPVTIIRSPGTEVASISSGGTAALALAGFSLLLIFGVLAGRRRRKPVDEN